MGFFPHFSLSALHNDLIWQAVWQANESNTEFPALQIHLKISPRCSSKAPDSIFLWHNNRISLILSYINYSQARCQERKKEGGKREEYDSKEGVSVTSNNRTTIGNRWVTSIISDKQGESHLYIKSKNYLPLLLLALEPLNLILRISVSCKGHTKSK